MRNNQLIENRSKYGDKEMSELEWIRHIHRSITDCIVGLSGFGIDTDKEYIHRFNTHFKKEINEFYKLKHKMEDKMDVYYDVIDELKIDYEDK